MSVACTYDVRRAAAASVSTHESTARRDKNRRGASECFAGAAHRQVLVHSLACQSLLITARCLLIGNDVTPRPAAAAAAAAATAGVAQLMMESYCRSHIISSLAVSASILSDRFRIFCFAVWTDIVYYVFSLVCCCRCWLCSDNKAVCIHIVFRRMMHIVFFASILGNVTNLNEKCKRWFYTFELNWSSGYSFLVVDNVLKMSGKFCSNRIFTEHEQITEYWQLACQLST